ncbi:unnamed protein product [Periconia digitata]|uniref:Uncharacterized protein n=1 Tax=Periconia digitata TaxID=1303443 RepID=A0A9W4U382_9PLEO|nr:unnamed protein product [Periconia digitata]
MSRSSWARGRKLHPAIDRFRIRHPEAARILPPEHEGINCFRLSTPTPLLLETVFLVINRTPYQASNFPTAVNYVQSSTQKTPGVIISNWDPAVEGRLSIWQK